MKNILETLYIGVMLVIVAIGFSMASNTCKKIYEGMLLNRIEVVPLDGEFQ